MLYVPVSNDAPISLKIAVTRAAMIIRRAIRIGRRLVAAEITRAVALLSATGMELLSAVRLVNDIVARAPSTSRT